MKKALLILSFCFPVLGFSQTWSDRNSSISNDLEDVFFIDNNNGWAVGRQGKIIQTTDGGSTWSEQNSGSTKDLNKVYMISTSNGYVVGDGGTVLKYNGSGWSALNISFSQDMYGVYFLDASTGWVSGDWGRIMMTTNGGSTWTTQMSNSIYSNTFEDLHMLSANEGWAVGSSGRVLKYDGTNWNNVNNPATANLTDLHGVSFISSNDGFMVGESSTIYHWDGSSWNTNNTALSSNSYHVYDVRMINGNLGYAATSPGFGGEGIILKYNGSTWVKDYEYTGMNSELFTGITSTPNGNIIAVASIGIIKMKSGGSTPTGVDGIETDQKNVSVYPNPFSSNFVIRLSQAGSEHVSLSLTDLQGRVLKAFYDKTPGGNSSISVDAGDLANGIYFYTLTTSDTSITGKLVKE